MSNEKIRSYYDALAGRIESADATRNKAPDSTEFDVAYMKEFADPSASLLELGAGTGLLLNRIMDDFGQIVAVELYPAFSKFITPAAHVQIVNADLLGFETDAVFDIVILFGVMNYFNAEEAAGLYRKIARWVKPGGKLVVKNQMGRTEDVVVDGLSQELQSSYYSEYRTPAHEMRLIESTGLKVLRQDDIYPEHFNRWPNTRFVALLAERPADR
ncbi:class I SAM-dependent methyltransferase [Arenimonas sp.]|uniref:class I SAM-dependent methyltransferase n=1 Tax=Arenimonas sp. TaxID=1872635 RepID=UPI0039E4D0B8